MSEKNREQKRKFKAIASTMLNCSSILLCTWDWAANKTEGILESASGEESFEGEGAWQWTSTSSNNDVDQIHPSCVLHFTTYTGEFNLRTPADLTDNGYQLCVFR